MPEKTQDDVKFISHDELALELGQEIVDLVTKGYIQRKVQIFAPGFRKEFPKGLVFTVRTLKPDEHQNMLEHPLLLKHLKDNNGPAYTHAYKIVRLASQIISLNDKPITQEVVLSLFFHHVSNQLMEKCFELCIEHLDNALNTELYFKALEEGELKNLLEGN